MNACNKEAIDYYATISTYGITHCIKPQWELFNSGLVYIINPDTVIYNLWFINNNGILIQLVCLFN